MLESQRLVIRPCIPSAPVASTGRSGGRGAARVAEILDPDRGAQVGFVYRRSPRSPWWRWLVPGTVAVHEAEDEPLVFTVERPWLLARVWEVLDADGHVVGAFRPARSRSLLWFAASGYKGEARGVILDRFGELLGVVVGSPEPDGTETFLKPEGVELAQVSTMKDQVLLTFADGVHGNPILKMLMLAAAVLARVAV